MGEGDEAASGTDNVNATVVPEEELDGTSGEQATENVDNTAEEGATSVPENVQIGDQAQYSDVKDTEDEPVIRQEVPVGKYSMFSGDAVSLIIGWVSFETSGMNSYSLFAKALNNNEMVDGTLMFDRDAFHFRHIINI